MFKTQFLRLIVVATIFSTCLFFSGCEKNEIEPQQAETLVTQLNLHPLMSGINDTPFGLKAQKKLSPDGYKQVLSEVNFLLQNSGMYDYQKFVEQTSDKWFDGNPDEVGYSISNDEIMPRSAVQNVIKNGAVRNARHIMNVFITSSGTKNVRVHKSVNAEWQTAISQAVAAWNALGYGVKFTISYTNSVSDLYNLNDEIDVRSQSTDPANVVFDATVYAATSEPTADGKIGEAMHISSTHSNPSASCKKMVIAHELGHALGLKHTDFSYSNLTYFNAQVSGCGVGTTDPTSIMNKGVYMYDNIPWQGFTTCDKKVIDYYW